MKLLPFVEITLLLRHYLEMVKTVLQGRFVTLAIGIVSGFIQAVFILGMMGPGFAAEIKIAWDPNTEEDLAGYKVYYGMAPWSFMNIQWMEMPIPLCFCFQNPVFPPMSV